MHRLCRLFALRQIPLRCTLLAAASSVVGLPLLAATIVAFSYPRPAFAANGQCVWEGGSGGSDACQQEDCIGAAGGRAQCTEPVVAPPVGIPVANVDDQKFTYGACDYEPPAISAEVLWCHVEGGQWVGTGCSGLP